MKPVDIPLILTCEHATARVPAAWAKYFAGRDRWLTSHRGWDPGALDLAKGLQQAWQVTLLSGRCNRLLVDLNRPEDAPDLFSSISRKLPDRDKEHILETLHRAHWKQVEQLLEEQGCPQRPVLHIGVHSFTPVRCGERRKTDIGILFDPARSAENRLATAWIKQLQHAVPPNWTVEANRPYLGRDPGMTTHFRNQFGPRYMGLELEVNSRRLKNPTHLKALGKSIAASLYATQID